MDLGISLVTGVGVGIDAVGFLNIFPSRSLDIFSYPSKFLSLTIFRNSSVVIIDKLDITLSQKKTLGFFYYKKSNTLNITRAMDKQNIKHKRDVSLLPKKSWHISVFTELFSGVHACIHKKIFMDHCNETM